MKINPKNLIIMLCSMLLFIHFLKQASAKDIQLGSTSFTPLIIIPIAVIIISIILILILVFKADISKKMNQYYQRRSDRREYEGDPISAKNIDIINNYIQKLQLLLMKQKSMEDMMIWNKFSVIVRNFFKEFLDIEYEFTDSELIHELVRKRQSQRMIDIVKQLDIRYSQSITRKDIEDIERDFEQILYTLNTKEVRKFERPIINKKSLKDKNKRTPPHKLFR